MDGQATAAQRLRAALPLVKRMIRELATDSDFSRAWVTSPATAARSRTRPSSKGGRHSLAWKIFHGRSGQLYLRYQDGMEDQIGALGLVLNARVLFDTRYMDAAVNQLRAGGFDVRDEDVVRLSPFVRHHVTMLGQYPFRLSELPGVCGLCVIRTPPASGER